MERATILITRPVPPEANQRLSRYFSVRQAQEGEISTPQDLIAALVGCQGVLSLLTERFDEDVFRAAPELKIVANMAVGYDNIEVSAARRHGVIVTNTPGVLTETTADLAMALLLASARRITEGDRYVREGRFQRWGPLLFTGPEVHGRTLGILGMGRIGQATARRAHFGFGMKILAWSPPNYPVPDSTIPVERIPELGNLLPRVDFLSLHLPLNSETYHLIDQEKLALLKPSAVLINSARGPLVDEDALATALESRALFAAGLDVYENEPRVHPSLLDSPHAVLLPHIGSASVSTREKMALLAADNLIAVLQGRPPINLVQS